MTTRSGSLCALTTVFALAIALTSALAGAADEFTKVGPGTLTVLGGPGTTLVIR